MFSLSFRHGILPVNLSKEQHPGVIFVDEMRHNLGDW